MKKQKTFFMVLILVSACSEPRINRKSDSIDDLLNRQLERFVSESSNIPGGWLMVDLPDKQISIAKGVSSVEEMQPLHPDVLFRMASVSKMFTSVIIMQLVEEGIISLTDRTSEYINQNLLIEIQSGESSIQNLLQHTSGIDDYVQLNWVETLQSDPSHFWRPEELLMYVRYHGEPKFEPGEDYFYSDTNYVLLGLIIEKVTGKKLSQSYHDRILSPLGMSNTHLEAYSVIDNLEIANGYFDEFNLSSWSTSSDWAGGGLVSTVADLTIFMQGLKNGKLFENEGTFRTMQQWVTLNSRSSYGLGIGNYSISNQWLIGHGGQGFGFTCGVYWFPEKEATIVIAVNQQATSIDLFEQNVVDAINEFY